MNETTATQARVRAGDTGDAMTFNEDYLIAPWMIVFGIREFRFLTKDDLMLFSETMDYSIPVPAILFDEDNSRRN